MKSLSLLFILLLLSAIAFQLVAQDVVCDSLVQRLHRHAYLRNSFELGQLDVQTYTVGTSHCDHQGIVGRLLPHLLPFQASPARDEAFEAFSHVQYQWPGAMHFNTTALSATQPRTSRRIVRELYQALLPIYATRRYKDHGSDKSCVLPFYDEGPERYQFGFVALPDSLMLAYRRVSAQVDTSRLCCVRFTPLRRHHTMLQGRVLVDSVANQVLGIDCDGRIDLATFSSQILFQPDTARGGLYIPHSSHTDIRYRYLGTRSHNSYYTRFRYLTFTPFDSLDRQHIPYDLTPYYADEPVEDSLDFKMLRPFSMPPYIDSLLSTVQGNSAMPTHRRQKRRIETFSEMLVDGSRFGPDHNRLRIYGPLDPASLGYDKFNGFTLRERARWTCRFPDDSELYMRGELGYAFRLREVRFRLLSEWTYLPRRRGRLKLEVRRSNSTFSSKFINSVNEALSKRPGAVNFDSLGLDYYQRYETTLEHSIELTNGLMLYAGILDTYRRPVKTGVRRATEEHRAELIDSHYADFAPFVRLEWTPRQYYWYDQGYKRYVHSPAPTFSMELSRAIPGMLGAESNYGRAEFDVEQSMPVARTRTFAYHFGFGKFFNQRGEYFINYRYFARSQYPESWEDDRIGGTFHLLDDYWYASSPGYVQGHIMYETPFGLLHLLRPISRYLIKERLYLGTLWSEGKSYYNELGYGIANNYFNVGCFIGFKDLNYYSVGVKFRIEIGDHL